MQDHGASSGEQEIPADYPCLVSSWVAETIPELEAGIHNGTLSELLDRAEVQEVIGPNLLARYQAIASEKLKHDATFRAAWTARFIAVFQRSLQPPRKVFPARIHIPRGLKQRWSIEDSMPPPITASHYQGDVILRPDQALSARRWGVWFAFQDEMVERAYSVFLVRKALDCLTSNIKNLWNIEATYLAGWSKLGTPVAWRSDSKGTLFEHLMKDVLNEHAPVARPAPLAEDILERTDLRVSYRSVKRKQGSRVQVALTADPEMHQQKVNGLYLPGEFILLTPLELAASAVHPPNRPQFEEFLWREFWASLGGETDDEVALAEGLRRLFIDAVTFPTGHPSGPMWILPPVLRRFIQTFTEYRAGETTNCVRERMEKSKRRVDSADKFTGAYWRAKFAEAAKGESRPATKDQAVDQIGGTLPQTEVNACPEEDNAN